MIWDYWSFGWDPFYGYVISDREDLTVFHQWSESPDSAERFCWLIDKVLLAFESTNDGETLRIISNKCSGEDLLRMTGWEDLKNVLSLLMASSKPPDRAEGFQSSIPYVGDFLSDGESDCRQM